MANWEENECGSQGNVLYDSLYFILGNCNQMTDTVSPKVKLIKNNDIINKSNEKFHVKTRITKMIFINNYVM
jgi:hypothetical protein